MRCRGVCYTYTSCARLGYGWSSLNGCSACGIRRSDRQAANSRSPGFKCPVHCGKAINESDVSKTQQSSQLGHRKKMVEMCDTKRDGLRQAMMLSKWMEGRGCNIERV